MRSENGHYANDWTVEVDMLRIALKDKESAIKASEAVSSERLQLLNESYDRESFVERKLAVAIRLNEEQAAEILRLKMGGQA